MNETVQTLLGRKSIRAYQKRDIAPDVRRCILDAALRAPTAGNLMLYSIIEVSQQSIKDRLVETCDHQPFIAKAPWVLLFLADYQRWYDYFEVCGALAFTRSSGLPQRLPQSGDLMLALNDAIIAAQTAVIAAESYGIGSCYIGDIMENYEVHRELFDLPRYVFPACLVCFGYPTSGQTASRQPARFEKPFIVFENKYRRLNRDEFTVMFSQLQATFEEKADKGSAQNIGQAVFRDKFSASFALEMNRSVSLMLQNWQLGGPGAPR